jgi:hypothetical protein
MNVGMYTRGVHDSLPVGVDFSEVPEFAATPVTAATVSATGLTLGTPDVVSTENVVAFRVSGGTAGTTVTVTVEATNGADTMCVSVAVNTLEC